MFLQAREIQLREIGGCDRARFDEPRQMSERKKRELLVGAGHRHVDRLPAHRMPLGRKLFTGRDGIEDDRRLCAAEVRDAQTRVSCLVPARAVQLLDQPPLLIGRERHAGNSHRRLQHVDGDRLGILRDRRERAGQEHRAETGRGEAFDESTPIDRALLFVQVVPRQASSVRSMCAHMCAFAPI